MYHVFIWFSTSSFILVLWYTLPLWIITHRYISTHSLSIYLSIYLLVCRMPMCVRMGGNLCDVLSLRNSSRNSCVSRSRLRRDSLSRLESYDDCTFGATSHPHLILPNFMQQIVVIWQVRSAELWFSWHRDVYICLLNTSVTWIVRVSSFPY